MPVHYRVRLGRRFAAPESSAALVTQLQEYFDEALAQAPRSSAAVRHADAQEGYAK
jgi:hypothetical protein